jgi:hypothetical protein
MKSSTRSLLVTALLVFSYSTFSQQPSRGPGKGPAQGQRPGDQRIVGGPRIGDAAPDFKLKAKDGDKEVQLASFKGKRPVVLVFGSYT